MYSLPVLLLSQFAHSRQSQDNHETITRQIKRFVPFVCIIFMLIPTPIFVLLLKTRQRQDEKDNTQKKTIRVKGKRQGVRQTRQEAGQAKNKRRDNTRAEASFERNGRRTSWLEVEMFALHSFKR
jgi:hypothetical protein